MANPLARRIVSLEHEYGHRRRGDFVQDMRQLTELLMSDEVTRDLCEECAIEYFVEHGQRVKALCQAMEDRIKVLRSQQE